MDKFRLLKDSKIEEKAKAGTVVYRLNGWDYGCSREDTQLTGEKHIAVTLKESGDYPFFTVPIKDLEELQPKAQSSRYSKPIHLSELHIPGSLDSLYIFGEVVASANAGGMFFLWDFARNISFFKTKGQWGFYEPPTIQEIDPEVASWQFKDLLTERHSHMLPALLGGYARKAYQLLDPVYPGFTDAFLGHLIDGPILSVTKPRKKRLDLASILSCCGCSINFNHDFDPPVLVKITGPTESVSDLKLLLATLVIALAGMDLKKWIQQLESIDGTSEMVKILGAFSRREHHSSWDGIIPNLLGLSKGRNNLQRLVNKQHLPVVRLLLFIQTMYDEEKEVNVDLYENGFKLLKVVTDELLPNEPLERVHYLEGIMDGFEYLSKIAAEQGWPIPSMRQAQSSKMVLQLLAKDFDEAEARLSRAEMLSGPWQNLKSEEPLDKYQVFSFLTYASSASIADLAFFSISRQTFETKKSSNHLWTALWNALQRQRQAMRLACAVMTMPDPWEANSLETFSQLCKNAVKIYLDCLIHFSGALESAVKPEECESSYINIFSGNPEEDKKVFLHVERDGLIKLSAALQTGEFDKSAIDALKELVASIQ